MKLSSKLSIVYSLLFFAVINLFGIWMIFDVHKTELRSVTFDANDQTMNILHVLGEESGEISAESSETEQSSESEALLESVIKQTSGSGQSETGKGQTEEQVRQILGRRLLSVLGGAKATRRGAEIRKHDGSLLVTSLWKDLNVTEELMNPGDMLIQDIQKNGDETDLLVSGSFVYGDEPYILIYTTDITDVYKAQRRYIGSLLIFDAIGGVLIAIFIMIISKSISKPLSSLTESVNQIASGDLEAKLPEDGDTAEVKQLSKSVGIMQEQIRNRIGELQERNEEQERFIGSLTHEIRTPLTSIIGYSSLLGPFAKDPQMKEGLSMIHSGGVRIQKLTESLIRLLTVDKEEIKPEPTDLKELCDKVAEQYKLKAEEKGITLSVRMRSAAVKAEDIDIPASLASDIDTSSSLDEGGEVLTDAAADIDALGESVVSTDAGLASILISNLVDNAMKATWDCQTREVEIICSGSSVTVIDTGKGIPKEEISKIFEPFFMVDKSRKHTYGGFGLGLAICAKIKDVLGLKMDIQSQVAIGTEVTVQFPFIP